MIFIKKYIIIYIENKKKGKKEIKNLNILIIIFTIFITSIVTVFVLSLFFSHKVTEMQRKITKLKEDLSKEKKKNRIWRGSYKSLTFKTNDSTSLNEQFAIENLFLNIKKFLIDNQKIKIRTKEILNENQSLSTLYIAEISSKDLG